MKETEKKILKATAVKVQEVVRIESCRSYRMQEDVQNRDEITEQIGTGNGAEARRLETESRSMKSGQQRKIATFEPEK